MSIVIIRGWSYGFSLHEQKQNYTKLITLINEIGSIKFIAWDGDPLTDGGFSYQIKELMLNNPELKFVAFKKFSKKEKLLDSYNKLDKWGINESGYVNSSQCEFLSIDDFTKTFVCSKQLTVVTIPDSEIKHYTDLSFISLKQLKKNNIDSCITILFGGGDCVCKEIQEIKNNITMYPSIIYKKINTSRINKHGELESN